MRILLFVAVLVLWGGSAHALTMLPTFCEVTKEHAKAMKKLEGDIEMLSWSGYFPKADRLDIQEGDADMVKAKKYQKRIQEMLALLKETAKDREEAIYIAHPPESGDEYMRCCVYTCGYLSRNRKP